MSTKKSDARSEASSSGSKGESLVVDCGRSRSFCGYCQSSNPTSITHGLWAESMTVDDYQDLLDRGWRRSGCYVYKPEMNRTCCPSYTIRLKAGDFVPSKDQLRVRRRMERFLVGQLDVNKTSSAAKKSCYSEVSRSTGNNSLVARDEEKNVDPVMNALSERIDNVVNKSLAEGQFLSGCPLPKFSVKKVAGPKTKQLADGSELLIYTSNIAFQLAAAYRRAHSTEKDPKKLRTKEDSSEESGPSPKTIAEKLVTLMNDMHDTSDISVRACNGHINFFSSVKDAPSNKNVQPDPISKQAGEKCERKNGCSMKLSERPQLKGRRIEIHLKRSSFDPEEFALYQKYQLKVHNDRPGHVTETSYRRFLVESPLVYVPPSGDNKVPPCGFGSFHQQYVIDGHLVAVGVIDILPRCLSSKYLFWDPDYAVLSLGKYSALEEINWVKENEAHCPTLQYYYLGYYIHSCSKMRYKAAYSPSELLCPLRYQWVPFDIARPLLDRNKYVILSDFANLKDRESFMPLESGMELEHQYEDMDKDHSNDLFMHDERMVETQSESSDDDTDLENEDDIASGMEEGEVNEILIGLNGSRIRYKDIRPAIPAGHQNYLESLLRRYLKVVGRDLSERMVYSI